MLTITSRPTSRKERWRNWLRNMGLLLEGNSGTIGWIVATTHLSFLRKQESIWGLALTEIRMDLSLAFLRKGLKKGRS
jgi:hypothetical protein